LIGCRRAARKAARIAAAFAGLVGDLRLQLEAAAETDQPAGLGIIGAAGELDEAPPLEALAVRAAAIAEIDAVVVEVEGMTAGRAVEPRRQLVDRLEGLGFGPDGGQRHQHHRRLDETEAAQPGQHVGQIAGDRVEPGIGKHVGHDLDGDLGRGIDRHAGLLALEPRPGQRPADTVGEQAVRPLEGDQRRLGRRAETAVGRPRAESGGRQRPLQPLDSRTVRTTSEHRSHACS
jgi:hypothetical protein